MPAVRRLTRSLRAGIGTVALLLLAGCLQAWTGAAVGKPGAAGRDGADGRSATGGGSPGEGRLGSGKPTMRHVPADGVTVLLVEAGFSVQVTIGEPEEVTVWMDDNLVDLVETRVDGNQLRLGLRPPSRVRGATLSADVTVRSLEQITVSGASQVRLDSELVGARLVLTVLGTSEISGVIRAERVQAGVSGASRLALSGQADKLVAAASGASELVLAELTVADLDAVLTGAAVAEVAVRDTLAVQASGASLLRYRGSPRVTRQQSTGASAVHPVG